MWAKIDDQYYLNPKNDTVDRDEQDLHLAAIVYANMKRTRGFIAKGRLLMLCVWAKIPEANEAKAEAIASHLVEHRYFDEAPGGYQIHDFGDWNKSQEELDAIRDARSEAGRRGGVASGASRRSKRSKSEPNPEPNTNQNTNPSPYPVNSSSSSSSTGGLAEKAKETPADEPEDDPGESLIPLDKEWAKALEEFHQNIGGTSPLMIEDMQSVFDTLRLNGHIGWWTLAVQQSASQNKRAWSYVNKTLLSCEQKGLPPGSPLPSKEPTGVRNNGRDNSGQSSNGRQPKVGIGTVDDYALAREISEAERDALRQSLADTRRTGVASGG
jgi:hypothetical protein